MPIHLLGTNHVSEKSALAVKEQFAKLNPEIIAVELDVNRLQGLLSKEKPKITLSLIPKIGLIGFLFLLVGRYVQKKFGKIARLEPGVDMMTAVDLAKNNQLQLSLIDRPIEQTLKRLSKEMTGKEKRRLVYDMTLGLVFGKKQKVKMSLQDVPDEDMLTLLLTQVRERYPTFYNVLLDQRNFFMARKLFALAQKFPEKQILAVVGAGHVPGIEMYITQMNQNPLKL